MVCLLLSRYILNTKPSCSLTCCYTREFLTPIVNSRYTRPLFRQLCCRNSRQRHVTPDDFYRNIIISGYSVHNNHIIPSGPLWCIGPHLIMLKVFNQFQNLQHVSATKCCVKSHPEHYGAMQYNTIRWNNFYFSTIVIKAFLLM